MVWQGLAGKVSLRSAFLTLRRRGWYRRDSNSELLQAGGQQQAKTEESVRQLVHTLSLISECMVSISIIIIIVKSRSLVDGSINWEPPPPSESSPFSAFLAVSVAPKQSRKQNN